MIVQVQDILKDAMGLIGVLEIDESPTSSEMSTALRLANVMIDRWSTQHLMLRTSNSLSFTVTPGKYSYTIGTSGCDVTAPKPLRITSAFYRDTAGVDFPVEVVDITVYNNLPDKILSSGIIMYISYDPGYAQQASQKGSLLMYLPPDQPYQLFMEVDNYLSEFVNFTDVVAFEPAYYEAIIYGLAVRLFRRYNDPKIPIPTDLVQIAMSAIDNLKALNSVQLVAGMEFPGKPSKYNIYSDGQ